MLGCNSQFKNKTRAVYSSSNDCELDQELCFLLVNYPVVGGGIIVPKSPRCCFLRFELRMV